MTENGEQKIKDIEWRTDKREQRMQKNSTENGELKTEEREKIM